MENDLYTMPVGDKLSTSGRSLRSSYCVLPGTKPQIGISWILPGCQRMINLALKTIKKCLIYYIVSYYAYKIVSKSRLIFLNRQ